MLKFVVICLLGGVGWLCIVCISHKKHTFFNKLSRRRFWVKIYK